MINPIISAGSNALQALEQLWSSRQPSAGAGSVGAFSTGQSLPAGANATSNGQAPSTPAGQFDAAALNFLTSLQDAGSSAAQQLTSSGYLSSKAEGAVQQGLGDLTDIVNKLEQALSSAGGASTSSATPTSIASAAAADLTHLASTASAAASALTSGTPTATVSALDELLATLQALGLGGHHHHHHGGGSQFVEGVTGSTSGATSGVNSGTGAASVAAAGPTTTGATS